MMPCTPPSVRSYTSPCAAANLIPRRLSSVRRPTPPGNSSHATAPSSDTTSSYVRASTVLKSAASHSDFSANVSLELPLHFCRLSKIMRHINRLHRLARLSSASALLLSALLASAQAPAPRIRGPIELTPSVPLAGSLNPRVRLSDDLGPLAPGTLIR